VNNGDCTDCGHQAGTREIGDEQNCRRRNQHITDEI
jgi:hypothetical protein